MPSVCINPNEPEVTYPKLVSFIFRFFFEIPLRSFTTSRSFRSIPWTRPVWRRTHGRWPMWKVVGQGRLTTPKPRIPWSIGSDWKRTGPDRGGKLTKSGLAVSIGYGIKWFSKQAYLHWFSPILLHHLCMLLLRLGLPLEELPVDSSLSWT